MFLKEYLPKNEIKYRDKREYKKHLSSKGFWSAADTFLCNIKNIIFQYIKMSKNEKKRSYIHIYYNAADYPILTISSR